MNSGIHYLDQPIFITGFNKSGTTLLLSLLDNHPQLLVFPEELQFFNEVLGDRDKARAVRERTGFRRFLPNRKTEKWSQGEDWFQEGYPEYDCTRFNQLAERALQTSQASRDLLLSLVEAFAEADNIEGASKTHWVSKSTQEEIFFPVMLRMFGTGCKLIYVVRDPRDVYLSLSKRRAIAGKQQTRSNRGLINFCVCWQTQVNRVIHYQKKHRNLYIFRYENLLIEPETTLVKLCDFLQIRFSEDLLQPTRHGKPWGGNSVFSKGFEGLSKEPIGRHKEMLDPRENFLIGKFLSNELVLLGYDEDYPIHVVEDQYFKTPWFDYWVTYVKYHRWYLYKQYSNLFWYSISQLQYTYGDFATK